MFQWLTNLVENGGYLGIVFLMFLENVFPPIPSELIMPLGGFVANKGELSLVGVILAGTVGSILGQLPLYYLGYAFGKDRIRRLADRHGRWLTVDGADIDKAAEWFDRRGGAAVLICRLVPGVRSLISIPAGIDRMPLPKFLIYTAIGTVVWTALLGYLGYVLGENYQRVEHYVGPVSKIVLGLLVVGYIVRVIRKRSNKPNKPDPAPAPTSN